MENQDLIRLIFFFGIFATMAMFEIVSPGRPLQFGRKNRWFTSWSIVVLDSVLVKIAIPIGAFGMAVWVEQQSLGLFNWIKVPSFIAIAVSFLILDWSIWFTHVLSHKIPILWRVHRMHHADPDMDVTTAIRFHPIEIILSMLWKLAVITALGAPPISVILFEIVLNGGAMFNHTNIRLPFKVEKFLRYLIVTPDMHRVHHSQRYNETDSNYGFSFSFWDRMFGTYTDQPADGHDKMKIGLEDFDGKKSSRLFYSLSLPFFANRQRRNREAESEESAG